MSRNLAPGISPASALLFPGPSASSPQPSAAGTPSASPQPSASASDSAARRLPQSPVASSLHHHCCSAARGLPQSPVASSLHHHCCSSSELLPVRTLLLLHGIFSPFFTCAHFFFFTVSSALSSSGASCEPSEWKAVSQANGNMKGAQTDGVADMLNDDRQTDSKTDRQTDIQTNRQTNRQTDKQEDRDRHTDR